MRKYRATRNVSISARVNTDERLARHSKVTLELVRKIERYRKCNRGLLTIKVILSPSPILIPVRWTTQSQVIRFQVSRENTRSNGLLFYLCLLALGLLDDSEVEKNDVLKYIVFFQLQSRRATPKQVNKGKRAIRLISYFRAKLGT